MKTLIIKDLACAELLDRTVMATVRGGWTMNSPYYKVGDVNYSPEYDSSILAVQNLGQQQSVLTATANDSAFIGGHVHVDSDVKQNGHNTIVG